ncbi:MAG: dihydroneopterin aldolase [Actinomycetota bacterium]|nr:dihydroneopterin aldolase [Actinomycetota bacterium]
MDEILIRGLRLEASVGVTDQERATPQPIRIDLEVLAHLDRAGETDELVDTVDYGTIVETVGRLVRSRSPRLLESLAEDIASTVTSLQGVVGVTVEVTKESPPVVESLERIGVRIRRPRT